MRTADEALAKHINSNSASLIIVGMKAHISCFFLRGILNIPHCIPPKLLETNSNHTAAAYYFTPAASADASIAPAMVSASKLMVSQISGKPGLQSTHETQCVTHTHK